MAFLVCYDLTLGSMADYTRLFSALKALNAQRILLSQWVIRGPYTAQQLRDHFWQYMDANDRLLVIEIKGEWASMRAMVDLNQV